LRYPLNEVQRWVEARARRTDYDEATVVRLVEQLRADGREPSPAQLERIARILRGDIASALRDRVAAQSRYINTDPTDTHIPKDRSSSVDRWCPLVRVLHPDVGGDLALGIELNNARDARQDKGRRDG
jgi:hypothetical protein